MFQYILLDLDGTITNPQEGITKSIQYALRKKGIEIEDLDSLNKFIGPPLRDGFMQEWGFSLEEAEQVLGYYREYFSVTGIYQNIPYSGIENMLHTLNREGRKLILATSKPEVFAKQITDHFGLTRYFTDVCGSSLDGSREKKGDVIRYAMEKNNITKLEQVVMVGDRKHDIIGAKANGIPSVGVLYGFGSREELADAGADYIEETVEDLLRLFLN